MGHSGNVLAVGWRSKVRQVFPSDASEIVLTFYSLLFNKGRTVVVVRRQSEIVDLTYQYVDSEGP